MRKVARRREMETTVEGGNLEQHRKRIKLQENMEDGGEDRISALPDCLLLEILSRLPFTIDAIRTGTLSKRWKHIWTSVSTIVFDDSLHTRPDFFSSIEKTLTQCHQLKLKKFLMSTSYDTRFQSQINSWIHYAISCEVEELNLWLWSSKVGGLFQLDQFFFINTSFTNLSLLGCVVNPIVAISWKNLRSLSIYFAKLNEDLIENILSGSPVLETLALYYCHGYRRLDITSKSVKNLVLFGYSYRGNESDDFVDIIKINAPNILSLTIEGRLLLWKVLLVNVSSLVEANLDYGNRERTTKEDEEEMLKGIMLNLCHVKELKVGVFCSKVLFRLEAKGSNFPSALKCPVIMSDSDSLEVGDSSDSDSDW